MPRSLARLCISSALFLLVMISSLAFAGAGGDYLDYIRREVRLNQFSTSAQDHVSLAVDGDGGFLVAWDSRRQEEGSYGVYARRLDSWGRRLGDELHVNSYTPSHQMRPSLDMDDAGAWLVWESWGQDGDAQAVIGRSADSDEILLSEQGAGSQEQPVAVCLDADRRLAVWTHTGGAPRAGASAIIGRLFDARGQAQSPEFRISEALIATDVNPSIATWSDGSFLVVWARAAAFGAENERNQPAGIMGRRYDAAGEALGPEFLVGLGGIEPSVAGAPDGSAILAWLENDGENYRAMAQRFAADGRPLGSAFPAGGALSGWQSAVAVAATQAGDFAVAWNQVSADGKDADVYAQFFDAAGRVRSAALRVNGHHEGWQGMSPAWGARRLALTEAGALAVVWHGDSGQGDASAANLTLLIPEPEDFGARLAMRTRLSFANLLERLPSKSTEESLAAAAPHLPPDFDGSEAGVVLDPETYFPGDSYRDEGFIAYTSTGWNPPDPHMACGPAHLMAVVNGGIAAYTKEGTQLWMEDIGGGGGFWAELGGTGFVFDPEVIYDPHEGRFMAMANERNNGSYFLLGISATSDPTGEWYKYRLNVTSLAGSDIDSPNIAVDDQAIYMTADFFNPQKYLVFIVDKASVINGGVAQTSSVLHTGSQSFGIPVQYDAAPNMYMIEHFETNGASSVRLWAVLDPLGTPGLISFTLPVEPYWPPVNSRSQGTSNTVETFDARFWSCVYRNGSLWACHHVDPDGSNSSDVARWYEIHMNGWPETDMDPSVAQWGQVLPGGTGYATFNSITANAQGQAAMCFAYSSPNDYYSIVRVMRSPGDPPGTMQAPVFVKVSDGAYSGGRWGDYSAMVVDPVDWTRFWAHHEYAVGSGTWHTWISNFNTDLTAAPTGEWTARIAGAYPNPSPGATRFHFSLARPAAVTLNIFDVRGRQVRQLAGDRMNAGEGSLAWDGRDDRGRDLASGHYLGVLSVDGEAQPGQRITLIR